MGVGGGEGVGGVVFSGDRGGGGSECGLCAACSPLNRAVDCTLDPTTSSKRLLLVGEVFLGRSARIPKYISLCGASGAGDRRGALLTPLPQNPYTYPAHFQCRVRARRGDDMHAERCPRTSYKKMGLLLCTL